MVYIFSTVFIVVKPSSQVGNIHFTSKRFYIIINKKWNHRRCSNTCCMASWNHSSSRYFKRGHSSCPSTSTYNQIMEAFTPLEFWMIKMTHTISDNPQAAFNFNLGASYKLGSKPGKRFQTSNYRFNNTFNNKLSASYAGKVKIKAIPLLLTPRLQNRQLFRKLNFHQKTWNILSNNLYIN